MSWTIRLAVSENGTHFTIYVPKENPRNARNKQAKSNEKDKTTALKKGNGDYVTTNFWKPLFMKKGKY